MELLVDPLNSLDVSGVPIVLLIDEHAIIRFRNPQPDQLDEFLRTDYATASTSATPTLPGGRWRAGDRLILQHRIDDGIAYYRRALGEAPDEARLYFRLGVALRMRFDSPQGRERDFVDAVQAWTEARRRDPNQYIWRRRIQQYGPVLDKPYPFYGWVEQARKEIRARGETPLPLSVEPTGAELAEPGRTTPIPAREQQPPDPEDKLIRDTEPMVQVEAIVVPTTESNQQAARVHLLLSPQAVRGYEWNNEAEPLLVWIQPDPDVRSSDHLLEVPNPPVATSRERRGIEFEISWPSASDPRATPLRGYAVYNLCNKQTGECMIRRQDFVVHWGTDD